MLVFESLYYHKIIDQFSRLERISSSLEFKGARTKHQTGCRGIVCPMEMTSKWTCSPTGRQFTCKITGRKELI